MSKYFISFLIGLLFFTACTKPIDDVMENELFSPFNSGFILYTIKQGDHFTEKNFYKPVEVSELKFLVKFDSSAIYQTNTEENQYDINKLYGFSDNNTHHHLYSARFGWSWNNNSLRLYGYVYNEGKVVKTELGTVAIGTEISCSIKIAGNQYIFSMNDVQINMPRNSTTLVAKGYLLYPYFGGDETAPHDIRVWIKNF